MMLKKYMAIFAMTLAWTILFGHSIIPHNHHDVQELPGHHFLSDEHHNGNDDHNMLVEAFAHFFHGADGITLIDSKISIDKTVKESIFLGALFTLTWFIDQPESQEQFFSPPAPVCQSPLIISRALRGPPVFIG